MPVYGAYDRWWCYSEVGGLSDQVQHLNSRETGHLEDSEAFRYDPAANRLNFSISQFHKVKDNRIKKWRDQEYRYDPWGNLVEKLSGPVK